MRHLSYDDMTRILAFEQTISPHRTLVDIGYALFGEKKALYRPPYSFTKQFLNYDLPRDIGSAFDVPIFFFSGAHDWQTPIALSDQWFSQIEAPHKELVHFQESSHFVVNEEPGKFLTALVSQVLPFAEAPLELVSEMATN